MVPHTKCAPSMISANTSSNTLESGPTLSPSGVLGFWDWLCVGLEAEALVIVGQLVGEQATFQQASSLSLSSAMR